MTGRFATVQYVLGKPNSLGPFYGNVSGVPPSGALLHGSDFATATEPRRPRMSYGPNDFNDTSAQEAQRPLPDYVYLSRWFRGPPSATTGVDSLLAYVGALMLACATIAVLVRRVWF